MSEVVTTRRRLTPRQERWIAYYIIHRNATRAAREAGYTPRMADAKAYLWPQTLATEIAEAEARNLAEAGVTAHRVLKETVAIATADIRKAVKWGHDAIVRDPETGEDRVVNDVALINSDEIDEMTAAAIKSVSRSKDGAIKIEFHDKSAALEKLGRYLKLWGDKSGEDSTFIAQQSNLNITFVYPDAGR